MSRFTAIRVFGICLFVCAGAQAATLYVSTTGDDANDGLSWRTAKKTVQAGLNAAQPADQVWVAAGTYVQCIALQSDVGLYGGFAGNETDLSQRNWATNVTILDGNHAGSVVTSPTGATSATHIDGFTITNGSGTVTSVGAYGGGLYLSNSSPTIANNTITNNGGTHTIGGGAYLHSSSPTITNNTITNNVGGGLTMAINCSATITNNTIAHNSGNVWGGGLDVSSSSPTITNNTITSNSAEYGGGVYLTHCSSATIANNTITDNSASGHGGGLHLDQCSATVANNTLTGNSAAYDGGGLYLYYSSPTITNTIIAFNSSGIYAVYGTPTIRYNCVFGNFAYDSSGVTLFPGLDGNIMVDPKLADLARRNYHIQSGSPCRNAGYDADVPAGWLDMDSQPRIQGSYVDIGADESDGTTWTPGQDVIVRVSPTGSDANDGSSWLLAKHSVQAGIDAAAAAGGEVWVAAGVYYERIALGSFAHVYGGFAGSETQRDQRNRFSNVTILDGNLSGSVVTARYIGSGWSTLDGFTIRNGNATYGGGLYLAYASPTVANNTIDGNEASNGAGLYLYYSSPRVANNTISGNGLPTYGSGDGGGLYLSYSSPTIVNCTIAGNSVGTGAGGGMYLTYSSPTIVNCTIAGNGASSGGGLSMSNSSPTIANTIIALNNMGICGNNNSTPTMRCNCVFGNAVGDYWMMIPAKDTDGNIRIDPKLADPTHRNYHIQPDSPCRNAGNDAEVQAGWLDTDGQPRIQGSHADIGADESDGTVWSPGQDVIVRVSSTGSDANDGSSWSLAKRTAQAGIDAATAAGGQVWVAAGAYYERITLRPFAHLYGGFAGSETQRDQRNWGTNITVLDGGQSGSVITASGIGPGLATLDGFTIRNGKAVYGGGVWLAGSCPMIACNSITSNSASVGGGGICMWASSPTITGNTITGNSAPSSCGGGMYITALSYPLIANNTITGNSACNGGGGIYLHASPTPTIVNTIIAFNSSGIYRSGTLGTPAFRCNCVFGNTAYNYSGVTDPTGTAGNVSVDPKLAGPAYCNLHIQPDSPCRNAGNDADVQAGWLDMDGQARIQGSHVDIGADESGGTSWTPGPYAVVRVSPGGDDANDGSSWSLSKRTVQAGIDATAAAGGQVWVAAGTYYERITLRPYSYVYGGFAGTETRSGQRNWLTNAAILDGQQGGSVVTATAGYRVSAIDGFTICNGNATNGGGVYVLGCEPAIVNNTITSNSASQRGGGLYLKSASPAITNNTISGNIATQYGGGLYLEYYSCPAITNSRITGNSAASGAGLYLYYLSAPMVANNTIATNIASSKGGGLCVYYFCSPTLINNMITSNSASSGGGLHVEHYSSPTVTGSTIAGNRAPSGGGLHLYDHSSPTVANTIVAFNASGICQSGATGTPGLRYNCIYGNPVYNYTGMTDPTDTNGNISVDPLFAAASAGPDGTWGTADDSFTDLHLQPGSTCINAGDPTFTPAPGETDLDGNPRTIGGRVDIGAYEYGLMGDINGDGYVNVADLQALVTAWGSQANPPGSNWNANADLNNDGYVNVGDLQLLVANWDRSN